MCVFIEENICKSISSLNGKFNIKLTKWCHKQRSYISAKTTVQMYNMEYNEERTKNCKTINYRKCSIHQSHVHVNLKLKLHIIFKLFSFILRE